MGTSARNRTVIAAVLAGSSVVGLSAWWTSTKHFSLMDPGQTANQAQRHRSGNDLVEPQRQASDAVRPASPVPTDVVQAIAALEQATTSTAEPVPMATADQADRLYSITKNGMDVARDRGGQNGFDAQLPHDASSGSSAGPTVAHLPWPATREDDAAVRLHSLSSPMVIEFNPAEHPDGLMRLDFPHDTDGGTLSIAASAGVECSLDGQLMEPGRIYEIMPGTLFTATGVVDVLIQQNPQHRTPPAGHG